MRALGIAQLKDAGVLFGTEEQCERKFRAFHRDPFAFMLSADGESRDRLWALISGDLS